MTLVSPEEWRAGGAVFEWQGRPIFYRVEGGGAAVPVLLVHGFPTSSWDWSPIWPRLVARGRVLTADMIGFGFSAKPRRFPYSILAQADLFEALLAKEGVSTYHLVAHDYGVSVGQELLARRAEGRGPAIATATFLNGGLFPEAHRPLTTQKLLASPLGPLVARLIGYGAFARAMRRIWGRRPLGDDELRAMWRPLAEHDGVAVMPQLISYIAERRVHRERWVNALVKAPMPVRLIDGLLDPVSGAHMVARYRELVPSPDVVELPEVGHYPQVEAPGPVADAILAHLEAGRA